MIIALFRCVTCHDERKYEILIEVRAAEPPLKQQNKAQHSTVAARHLSANDSTPVQNSSSQQQSASQPLM